MKMCGHLSLQVTFLTVVQQPGLKNHSCLVRDEAAPAFCEESSRSFQHDNEVQWRAVAVFMVINLERKH